MAGTVRMDVINLYQCDRGFRTPKRVLDGPYLLYVHKGTGRFRIGQITHRAAVGDLFYCPQGVENTILADEEDPFLLSGVEFSAWDMQEILDRIPEKINISGDSFLVGCLEEMVREYQVGKTDSAEICSRLLWVLLARTARMEQGSESRTEDLSDRLLEYILRNFNKPLTHETLSGLFSYHKNSINRALLKATGMTLKNYLIDIRIKKASEYLLYSDKTVGEIAELCGYSGSAFFSRQFRQKTGMTPLAFRCRQK